VDLTKVLDSVKNIKFDITKKIKGTGSLEVELQIPTLLYETKIINSLIESIKKDNDTEMGKSIGSVYTYEIVKYVSKVKYDECEIVFSDIPIKDRFKIIEHLPLATNKGIIEVIHKLKTVETDALTVNVNGKDETINIDVSFFDS
jgi:hypothetical protein